MRKEGFYLKLQFISLLPDTKNPDVQERICDYHGSLEYLLGINDFGNSLDGYDYFINDDEEGVSKGDPNEEGYQGPPN